MAYTGMASTFKTIGGVTQPNQYLFSIENLATSGTVVSIRRLLVQMDATAVLTAVMPLIRSVRHGTPSAGGTTLAKGSFDLTQASSTLVQCRGATASDLGTAVTLTPVTLGAVQWQQFGMRMHTAVGQVLAPDFDMLPIIVADVNFNYKLAAGEGLSVYYTTPTTTSNPATNFYFVNCVWSET